MKKIIMLTIASSTLLAASAFAGGPDNYQDQANNQVKNPIYVGVDGGVAIPAANGFGDELHTGWDIGAHAGYRINQNIRVEGAFSYLRNRFNESVIGFNNIYNNQMFFMANAYYDIPTAYHVTPFIGVGLGLMHAFASASGIDSDSTNRFAYQGIVGAAYNVTDNVSVNLAYHLVSWTGVAGFQNMINAGVDYHFAI